MNVFTQAIDAFMQTRLKTKRKPREACSSTTLLVPQGTQIYPTLLLLLILWTALDSLFPAKAWHARLVCTSATVKPPLPRNPSSASPAVLLPVVLHLCLIMGPAGCMLFKCPGLHAV